MREIKFRLLNKNTGLTEVHTLAKLIATTYRRSQFEFRGRFTGLKDKNGKEIYEGDILTQTAVEETHIGKIILSNYRDGLGVVEYIKDNFVWNMGGTSKELSLYAWGMSKQKQWDIKDGKIKKNTNWLDCLEIVGNIYENSNLTKKNGK